MRGFPFSRFREKEHKKLLMKNKKGHKTMKKAIKTNKITKKRVIKQRDINTVYALLNKKTAWTWKEIENAVSLSTGNEKLISDENTRFLIWSIPAVKTCPFRTEHCEEACYAVKAETAYPDVLPAREYNYLLSQTDCLAASMSKKGICHGSRVGILGFYSDFEPSVILATNKNGALIKMVSPDLNIKELMHSISDLDMIFVDGMFKDLEKVISKMNIPTVWNTYEAHSWNCEYYVLH